MSRLSKIGAAALAAFGWTSGGATTTTASYLVVAGGAGGGYFGAGGGAGGYQTGTTSLSTTQSYTVVVGSGGAAGTSSSNNGVNGSNSQLGTLTASVGGGYGAGNVGTGANGGSGGGGARNNSAGGTGTSGQGNNGGSGINDGGNYFNAGGGGGAGGVGGNAIAVAGNTQGGGSGGNGTASSISGSSVTYAGGGGGGGYGANGGPGGTGGGGTGGGDVGYGKAGLGTSGTVNLGAGGGGGANGYSGGAGGSGIVIISYAAPQKFGGGTVTTSGSNVIHTFTTSGTLSPLSTPLTTSYLIVAGGGAGGPLDGGGGGAGGMQTGSGVTIDTNSVYVVTVGAGGAGATYPSSGGASPANSGSNSLFSAYVTASVGGGGGGSMTSSFSVPQNGGTGGSGGGGSYGTGAVGGSGTSGQGNKGGDNNGPAAGGGGGAGAAGSNGVSITQGGAGGNGLQSSISGTATYYAGGGGGAADLASTTQALGGLGGGGNSAYSRANNGTAGTANTGGGGGGGVGGSGLTGYSGGSGIVIISYAGSQQMAGGTVTSVGGNTIHTFTSSGYLTPLKLVPNSLRFRGSSVNAYLNKTWSSTPTSTTTATFSFWFKRGKMGYLQSIIRTDTSVTSTVRFESNDQLTFQISASNGSSNTVRTTAVYRDPAAWYHIVWGINTATGVWNIYVNGVQVTAFAVNSPTSGSAAILFTGNGNTTYINGTGGDYVDGYLAEVNFIDGQSLTATSFGGYNSYGVWQPATYGGSYGTNGFYLPFTNKTSTTTLGYDFSPNGNNWTTNNISLTAGSTYDSMTDVPTLTSATAANYCVLNPLDNRASATITDGNLSFTTGSATGGLVVGTMAASSGKWYVEFTPTSSVANECFFGIENIAYPLTSADAYILGNNATSYAYRNSGLKVNNGSSTSYGASFTTSDVIGVALDLDAGTLTFYKNNTSQGVAFTGISGTYRFGSNDGTGAGSISGAVNFGQQGFKYTPPSGFVALNTYNI